MRFQDALNRVTKRQLPTVDRLYSSRGPAGGRARLRREARPGLEGPLSPARPGATVAAGQARPGAAVAGGPVRPGDPRAARAAGGRWWRRRESRADGPPGADARRRLTRATPRRPGLSGRVRPGRIGSVGSGRVGSGKRCGGAPAGVRRPRAGRRVRRRRRSEVSPPLRRRDPCAGPLPAGPLPAGPAGISATGRGDRAVFSGVGRACGRGDRRGGMGLRRHAVGLAAAAPGGTAAGWARLD